MSAPEQSPDHNIALWLEETPADRELVLLSQLLEKEYIKNGLLSEEDALIGEGTYSITDQAGHPLHGTVAHFEALPHEKLPSVYGNALSELTGEPPAPAGASEPGTPTSPSLSEVESRRRDTLPPPSRPYKPRRPDWHNVQNSQRNACFGEPTPPEKHGNGDA